MIYTNFGILNPLALHACNATYQTCLSAKLGNCPPPTWMSSMDGSPMGQMQHAWMVAGRITRAPPSFFEAIKE